MDNKKNHHHDGGNGLLIGAILGSVATLLFTTKKGRELMHEFADKGLEKIAEYESTHENKEIKLDEDAGNDYIQLEPQVVVEPVQKSKVEKEHLNVKRKSIKEKPQIPVPNSKKTAVKRFFRGMKKI